MKLSKKSVGRLQGLLAAMFLTACAGVTAIGAGCDAYRVARTQMPADDVLLQAPLEVLNWINFLDTRMTSVCIGRIAGKTDYPQASLLRSGLQP